MIVVLVILGVLLGALSATWWCLYQQLQEHAAQPEHPQYRTGYDHGYRVAQQVKAKRRKVAK